MPIVDGPARTVFRVVIFWPTILVGTATVALALVPRSVFVPMRKMPLPMKRPVPILTRAISVRPRPNPIVVVRANGTRMTCPMKAGVAPGDVIKMVFVEVLFVTVMEHAVGVPHKIRARRVSRKISVFGWDKPVKSTAMLSPTTNVTRPFPDLVPVSHGTNDEFCIHTVYARVLFLCFLAPQFFSFDFAVSLK